MMRSSWHLGDVMKYRSTLRIESATQEGVAFTIKRMSFGRRMDLMRRIREVGGKIEFLNGGEQLQEKVEASLLAHEIDRLYVEWGLAGIEGLDIDGESATPELLFSSGPEPLCREIVRAIRTECGLTEDERKN